MSLDPGSDLRRVVTDYPEQCIVWFKEQSSRSYQVRVQYEFDGEQQDVFIYIKGQSDGRGALLLGVLSKDVTGTVWVRLYHKDAGNMLTKVAEQATSDFDGFFNVEYDQAARVFRVSHTPAGGPIVQLAAPALTQIEDLDLGQNCGIGLSRESVTSNPSILVVDGGPV
jgi:hypothetical protein